MAIKTIEPKTKLRLLEHTPGINKLILDIVKEVTSDCNDTDIGQIGEIALARYTADIIKRLVGTYKTQMRVQSITVKQQDLEVLIENLRTGEEPEFVNKHTKK